MPADTPPPVGLDVSWFANPERLLIAIGGCARSGTTLLSTMLSAHPRVHLYARGKFDRETGVFCGDPNQLPAALGRLLEADPPHAGATHWCEKTPANIHHVDRIRGFLGDRARFLNIVRDGRDVVCSVHPSRPDSYWVPPTRWVDAVGTGRALEGTPGFTTIRYEDLIREQRATLESLCWFLDLPFDESLMAYPGKAAVRKSGAWFGEDAQPLHADSIGRWRDPTHIEAASALIEHPGAVELLAFYGYL